MSGILGAPKVNLWDSSGGSNTPKRLKLTYFYYDVKPQAEEVQNISGQNTKMSMPISDNSSLA